MAVAMESPTAPFWKRLLTQELGSSTKALAKIDELAGIITKQIMDGNVGQKEVDAAVRDCDAAYARR
jgi:hypothetical protein